MSKKINGESGQADDNLKNDLVETEANERRVAVKKILAGSAITTGAVVTSKTWVKPVVDATFLPAHAQMSEDVEEEPLQRDTYSLSTCDICGQSGGGIQTDGASISGSVTPGEAGVTVMVTYTLTRVGMILDIANTVVGNTPEETVIEITVPATTDSSGIFLVEAVSAADIQAELLADYTDQSVPPVVYTGSGFWKTGTLNGYFSAINFAGGYTLRADIAFSDTPDMIEETCSETEFTGAPCLA